MIKRLIAAVLASIALALPAVASPVVWNVTLLGNGGGQDLTAGLSSPGGSNKVTFTTPGSFHHRFKFSYAGNGWLNGLLTHVADTEMWEKFGIDFDRAVFLNSELQEIAGSDFLFDISVEQDGFTQTTVGYSDFIRVSGDFYLDVLGTAGTTTDVRDPSYSYSGLVQIMPTADVPEPDALLLTLSALVAAAWIGRRRLR
jgi:hypothetical protein